MLTQDLGTLVYLESIHEKRFWSCPIIFGEILLYSVNTDLFKKCVIFGGTRTNGHYGFKEGVPQSPKKLIRKKSVGGFERK